MKAEKTEFKFQGMLKLRDGTVVLTGALGGPQALDLRVKQLEEEYVRRMEARVLRMQNAAGR